MRAIPGRVRSDNGTTLIPTVTALPKETLHVLTVADANEVYADYLLNQED